MQLLLWELLMASVLGVQLIVYARQQAGGAVQCCCFGLLAGEGLAFQLDRAFGWWWAIGRCVCGWWVGCAAFSSILCVMHACFLSNYRPQEKVGASWWCVKAGSWALLTGSCLTSSSSSNNCSNCSSNSSGTAMHLHYTRQGAAAPSSGLCALLLLEGLCCIGNQGRLGTAQVLPATSDRVGGTTAAV